MSLHGGSKSQRSQENWQLILNASFLQQRNLNSLGFAALNPAQRLSRSTQGAVVVAGSVVGGSVGLVGVSVGAVVGGSVGFVGGSVVAVVGGFIGGSVDLVVGFIGFTVGAPVVGSSKSK